MDTTFKKPILQWNNIKGEILRKSIHLLVSIVPFIASFNYSLVQYLLSGGILLFTLHEYLRLSGKDKRSILTKITDLASRDRDKGHIVLGPITLGLGALLSLTLFQGNVSTIAIFALAFGDGLASLSGKIFGKTLIPFSDGKTLVGSLTCFFAVFIASIPLTGYNLFYAFIIALGATILEALPLKDIDNIIIPVGTGMIAYSLGI